MPKENLTKKTTKECCEHHKHNPILMGFKFGFGFWLAALAIWLIVSAIVAGLYYLL